jgi:hypothetical protein
MPRCFEGIPRCQGGRVKAEDYAPLVIDAASIDTRPNVYYLMPFAERLSFVAQQIRALNLVWALAEMQKIQTNSHAAVIGAGLSGVTAACALAAYGCRVSVYEKSERPMWRQSETSHRLVHPEINYWPGGSPLTHTTSLPMLEWYFNECSEVIDLIRQQYEEIERANPLLNFFCSHSVTNVRSTSSELDGLVAVIATPPCNEPVHLAIVAVGFDEDRQWLNLPRVDYWKSDDLERDSLSRAFEHFIISGCGDGGMIDALRCSYKFDKGRLAVDLATKLDASGLSEDLRDAERSSQRVRYGKIRSIS